MLRRVAAERYSAFRHEFKFVHMPPVLDFLLSFLPLAVVLLHLICSPYTKVEESFNIQAAHDIIAYGFKPFTNSTAHIDKYYDHVSFPGSVPRTFTGALLLSGFTQLIAPFVDSPADVQLFVRAILGALVVGSLLLVRSGVKTAFGQVAGRWYLLLQCSQFHIMYYASRTLPNTFALILTNAAFALLLMANSVGIKSARGNRRRAVALYCLTIAGVVFRSEIAILLAVETSQMLLSGVALIDTIIPAGLAGLSAGLSLTVPIDSLFWRQWTWPELEGFYYNTILGKSSAWGTSPFHYYLLNAVPRLLLNPMIWLICLPVAFMFKATRQASSIAVMPHLIFIVVYSFLPHKEWRFIIYSIPAFTAVASCGAAWIWNRRAKSRVFAILSLLLVLSTVAAFIASTGLLYISSLNYPGGEALHRLHLAESSIRKRVYLDNLACQTGVTRFQQIQPSWTYDKTENKTILENPAFWQQFDYVIVEDPAKIPGSWDIQSVVQGFDGFTMRPEALGTVIPFSHDSRSLLYRLQLLYDSVADTMRSKLTRGYWPAIKMSTKLYILERDTKPAVQGYRPTIQM